MQPMFGVGVLWVNEDGTVPVQLEDASGNEMTGVTYTQISAKKSLNGEALGTMSPASGDWNELGHGLYSLRVPAATLNAEGSFVYRVDSIPTGIAPAFNGAARIERRTDRYEACCSPEYNEVATTFMATCWLLLNGQAVTAPTSCRVRLRENGGSTTPVDVSSVSPNAEGVFALTASEIALVANTNYEMLVEVVYNGVTYTSVDGGITFN